MKKVTLEEAFTILENASALVLDDDLLVYPALDQSDEEDEEYHFYLETPEYSLKFNKRDNETVELVGSCMFLQAADAEEEEHTQITVLTNLNLE